MTQIERLSVELHSTLPALRMEAELEGRRWAALRARLTEQYRRMGYDELPPVLRQHDERIRALSRIAAERWSTFVIQLWQRVLEAEAAGAIPRGAIQMRDLRAMSDGQLQAGAGLGAPIPAFAAILVGAGQAFMALLRFMGTFRGLLAALGVVIVAQFRAFNDLIRGVRLGRQEAIYHVLRDEQLREFLGPEGVTTLVESLAKNGGGRWLMLAIGLAVSALALGALGVRGRRAA